MPDALAGIWARADASEARFDADEVARWPEGREALLIEAGIIRRDDNARTVTCDACQDGHVEEVVRIEDPPGSPVRAYIPCPVLGRVAVPLERLEQWVVDFDGLAKAVARGLALAGKVEEVVPSRLWELGTLTTAGKRREVVLARGATWNDAQAVLGARREGWRDSVLLVPRGLPRVDVWADPPPAIALDGVARMERRRLVVDRAAVDRLAVGTPPRPEHRLTREQIEGQIRAAFDAIGREAGAMDEDDPRRPRPTQAEVARRIGLSRNGLQERMKLLNRLRVEGGLPKVVWEDLVRGPRT